MKDSIDFNYDCPYCDFRPITTCVIEGGEPNQVEKERLLEHLKGAHGAIMVNEYLHSILIDYVANEVVETMKQKNYERAKMFNKKKHGSFLVKLLDKVK